MVIYNKIADWMWYNSPVYIEWPAVWKCWREWWKARKYFLFPDLKFSFNKNKWIYGSDAKIFSFEIHPLQWKAKFSDNVFEGCPYILFQFFNKYQFVIEFTAPKKNDKDASNSIYYESILDKAYGIWSYKKRKQIQLNIMEVYENNIWKSFKQKGNDYELLTMLPYVRKNIAKEINQKLSETSA